MKKYPHRSIATTGLLMMLAWASSAQATTVPGTLGTISPAIDQLRFTCPAGTGSGRARIVETWTRTDLLSDQNTVGVNIIDLPNRKCSGPTKYDIPNGGVYSAYSIANCGSKTYSITVGKSILNDSEHYSVQFFCNVNVNPSSWILTFDH